MQEGERRTQKNWVLFAVLLALAVILFFTTILKIAQLSAAH